MEAVGAVSAILTIAMECESICKKLRNCLKRLKYARNDIRIISDELETFSILLGLFRETITDSRLSNEGLSAKIKASKVEEIIVRSGREALTKIGDILDDVRPLRVDKKYEYSALARWIARWRWSTRKEEWTPIQASLNSVKQSAQLLISMVSLEKLLRQLEVLRAEAQAIPNEMLQQLSVIHFHRVLSML
jgi:hypothetical protein